MPPSNRFFTINHQLTDNEVNLLFQKVGEGGYFRVLDILLAAKLVNPSSGFNRAFRVAFENGFLEVVKY